MDLKELSESVQQQQQQSQQSGGPVSHTTPKRPIRSLDKTIESCKAQLGQSLSCLVLEKNNRQWAKSYKCNNQYVFTGIDEISEDVYKGVDHSDSEDSEKSDSSDSEYLSDEEHKPKSANQDDKDKGERKWPKASTDGETKDGVTGKAAPETALKDKQASNGPERDLQDKPVTPQSQPATEKPQAPEEGRAAAAKSAAEQDSDSERELVIDLGDEQGGHESKKARRDAGVSAAKPSKESNVAKVEGEPFGFTHFWAHVWSK